MNFGVFLTVFLEGQIPFSLPNLQANKLTVQGIKLIHISIVQNKRVHKPHTYFLSHGKDFLHYFARRIVTEFPGENHRKIRFFHTFLKIFT